MLFRSSYLVGEKIIAAAKQTGAEAIHPGYGFLSENAEFAQAVIDAGIVWVGPNPSSITAMGLKDAAKTLMQNAGVPTTPGYLGEDQSADRLTAEAAKIEHDKHEAASYAIQLNKSRKEFETKLQMLKLRKGTLATQLAAARSAGGDAFGNDRGVWDRFQDAEDRIDSALIASEVDSAMRGEDAAVVGALEAKLAKLALAEGAGAGTADDDPLAQLKAKMAAARPKQLAGDAPAPGGGGGGEPGKGPGTGGAS